MKYIIEFDKTLSVKVAWTYYLPCLAISTLYEIMFIKTKKYLSM